MGDRGKGGNSSSLQDEQTKARNRLLSLSNHDDTTGSMVKMIAERVYYHMKVEFNSSQDKESLTRIKKSLLQATDDMLDRVVADYIISIKSSENSNRMNTNQIDGEKFICPKCFNRQAYDAVKMNNENIVDSTKYTISMRIVSKYVLHFADSLPKFLTSYLIVSSKENVVRGLLVDGEYITYELLVCRTQICKQNEGGRRSITATQTDSSSIFYRIERRHSEIKRLYSSLAKGYPNIIIPPFPSKSYPGQQKEVLIEQRKRLFILWLGFIANDSELQNDKDLISFSSGVHATINEWPSGDCITDNSLEFPFDVKQFAMFYPRTVGPMYLPSNSMEIQVLRDIHAIKRDLKRIQSDANETVDSCRAVLNSFIKLKQGIRQVQQSVTALEGLDEFDALLSQILSPAFALTDDHANYLRQQLEYHLLEPIGFLYDSVLPHASDLCEKLSKQLPNQLTAKASATAVADDSFLGDEEDDFSNVGAIRNNKKTDNIRQTVSFIRSYDYFTKYRAYSMFQNLKDISSKMVQQHSISRQYWTNIKRDIDKLTLNFCQNYSNNLPSLSDVSSSLKSRNLQEVQADANKAAQINSGNSKFNESRSSTWSYVRTFLDRPIIPTGSRKPPEMHRFSNRNYGERNSHSKQIYNNSNDERDRGDFAKDETRNSLSQQPTSSSKTSLNSGMNGSGSSAKSGRKIQRTAGAASLASRSLGGATASSADFYVKAPTPAATLSSGFSDASFIGRAYANDPLPAAPPSHTLNKSNEQTATENNATDTHRSSYSRESVHVLPDELPDPVDFTQQNQEGLRRKESSPVNLNSPQTDTNDQKIRGLPQGWEVTFTDDGQAYYYNVHTRVSRWDAPTDEVAAAVHDRIQRTKEVVDEAVQRRKQERHDQQQQEKATSQAAEAVRPEIQKAIQQWRYPKNLRRERDIGELLSTLHTIVCSVSQDPFFGGSELSKLQLTAQSPPVEIKKAYLRAARLIHPDKFTSDMVLEERLLAEEVFVVLTESYNAYKQAHDIV